MPFFYIASMGKRKYYFLNYCLNNEGLRPAGRSAATDRRRRESQPVNGITRQIVIRVRMMIEAKTDAIKAFKVY